MVGFVGFHSVQLGPTVIALFLKEASGSPLPMGEGLGVRARLGGMRTGFAIGHDFS
jgi:hypothetical protein